MPREVTLPDLCRQALLEAVWYSVDRIARKQTVAPPVEAASAVSASHPCPNSIALGNPHFPPPGRKVYQEA